MAKEHFFPQELVEAFHANPNDEKVSSSMYHRLVEYVVEYSKRVDFSQKEDTKLLEDVAHDVYVLLLELRLENAVHFMDSLRGLVNQSLTSYYLPTILSGFDFQLEDLEFDKFNEDAVIQKLFIDWILHSTKGLHQKEKQVLLGYVVDMTYHEIAKMLFEDGFSKQIYTKKTIKKITRLALRKVRASHRNITIDGTHSPAI